MPVDGNLPGRIFIESSSPPSADLVARWRKGTGEAFEGPLEIRDRTSEGGRESVGISISAPPSVEPGFYEVAVAAAHANGPTSDLTSSSFIPIFVEPSQASLSIDDGVQTAAGAATEAPSRKPPTEAQRKLARATREDYATALRHLAAEEREKALETLTTREAAIIAALDADGVEVLAQAQSQVLAKIADEDWELVMPVILMHLDASLLYRTRRQRILAHHATRMTIDLADAYADKLDTPEAKSEAARVLSSLGSHLLHGGAWSRARRIFDHALELDADDPAALLGSATIFEKRGFFDQALPLFERLVEARPEHTESALRLALNHRRIGDTEAAQSALDRLTRPRVEDWVALLAHQELARLMIDKDQPSRAARVLRRGLERWPEHPTLSIMLAYVLDVQGELKTSRELLEGLGESADLHPAGERHRYNDWSRGVVSESRRALAETAEARLEDLDRWLAGQQAPRGND